MKASKQTHPSLKHLKEFEEVLLNYAPSKSNIELLQSVPLILLVGPTAAGRNTLINLLVKTGRYNYIPSDTTRPMRFNNGIKEQNGKEYWFETEEAVLKGLKEGAYIEAAVIHSQQVSGVNIKRLQEAALTGRISVTEVEGLNGCATYLKYKPDILCIFLLPPDFETWMSRIRARGDMTEVELRRRLVSAKDEIAAALAENKYKFVINHEIHEAAVEVDGLVNGASLSSTDQADARSHAEQLAIDVQLYLNA